MTTIPSVLFDATALAAVVTFLVSILKPFVELLPFGKTGTSTHDATLRLLNVILNIALVYASAASVGQLTGATWLALAVQGLAQAAGSQTLYSTATRSGSSIGDSGIPAALRKLFTPTSDPEQNAQPAPTDSTSTPSTPSLNEINANTMNL